MRLRLWTKRLLTLAVAVWVVHYAYVRLTTPAAGPQAWVPEGESDPAVAAALDEASEVLTDILAELPADPVFDVIPPEGMAWVDQNGHVPDVDVTDILNGSWDPDSRPHLRVVVRYITQPAVTGVLEKVRAGRQRPFRIGYPMGLYRAPSAAVRRAALRNLSKLLVARARYRHAELGDTASAWDDIKTTLLLSDAARKNLLIDFLIAHSTYALAAKELQRITLEADIGAETAMDIDETLARLADPLDVWSAAIRGEAAWAAHMALQSYTDDGNGNGWLVLGDQSVIRSFGGPRLPQPQDRNPVWRLASGLFNDRRSLESETRRRSAAQADAARMAYRDALVALESRDVLSRDWTVLDGPPEWILAAGYDPTSMTRSFQFAVTLAATLRAARILVALNRHRADTGSHPNRLDALVPGYLDTLPLDPFCDGAFGYRPNDDGTFLLYARGLDGDDDGGTPSMTAMGRPHPMGDEGDQVYPIPRPDPYNEPELRPKGRTAIGAGAAAEAGNDAD